MSMAFVEAVEKRDLKLPSCLSAPLKSAIYASKFRLEVTIWDCFLSILLGMLTFGTGIFRSKLLL